MNCVEVQQLLSAFYDGELSHDRQLQVLEHVGRCSSCAGELAGFEKLTRMTRGLAEPVPPGEIWDRLGSALDEEASVRRPTPASRWQRSASRTLALAAVLLLAAGLGWLGYDVWSGHRDHGRLATSFGSYLDRFHDSPEAAQALLVDMYDARPVDPGQAVNLVGFRPAAADHLPAGYDARATYVLKMPCCTCVQTVCRRPDGSTIAIFEHEDEHREWLGARRMETIDCNGTQCVLCNIDDRLAATWQRGSRHITIIGLQDANELEELVSWLDRSHQQDPS